MSTSQAFLEQLKAMTRQHLEALADESAAAFAAASGLAATGTKVYHRLIERFDMDGAQEIGTALVAVASGEFDSGAVALRDREYRGLRLILGEYGDDLPTPLRDSLADLIRGLGAGQ